MNYPLFLTTLTSLALPMTSLAEIIASTTFDGRIANSNTAENIPWIVNGVENPGNMSASQFEGNAINLFNNTTDVQDRFVPGLNVGNTDSSWVTSVKLTPVAGSSVTIDNISFDYVAISGNQVINVNRRSDFEVTLLDPNDNPVASGSVSEANSGNNLDPVVAPVSINLDTPVSLDQPGDYFLIIRGGDFLGDNETGNHTGIDNLTINGTVGGASSPAITSIDVDPETGMLSLTWASSPGSTYTVQYSGDLTDWSLSLDQEIPADDGSSTTFEFDLNTLPDGFSDQLFFRVEIE